jgi:hypothetical protein
VCTVLVPSYNFGEVGSSHAVNTRRPSDASGCVFVAMELKRFGILYRSKRFALLSSLPNPVSTWSLTPEIYPPAGVPPRSRLEAVGGWEESWSLDFGVLFGPLSGVAGDLARLATPLPVALQQQQSGPQDSRTAALRSAARLGCRATTAGPPFLPIAATVLPAAN